MQYGNVKSLPCFLLVSIAIFSLIFIPPGYVFAQSQGVPDITSGLENYYFITKNFPEEDGVNISAFGIYGDCDGKISKTAEEEKKGKKGNTVDEVPSKDCVFSVDAIRIDSPKTLGEGDDAEEPMFDVLCIDDFNLDLTAGWSTCTFITQGDISMSLGVSVDACPHFLGLIGSVLTLGAGWGVCGGTNLFSVDLPWVVGINLKLPQAKYKELSVGGNILQDSGIGGVKARQFVVATVAQNGLAGDITFLGKKPHNMELFLGVTDHSMQQKCFSEVRLDKEVACSSVNSEFADALKSGCLNCPLSGPFNPQIQNMIAAEPDGTPDNVLDEVKLGEILDADTLKTMSDFSLGLVDESSKIALDAVVDSFDDLDLDGIVAEVEREALSEVGKLEDTLTKAIAGTGFVDLDDLIKKIPKLVMDIENIISDIESIVSSWDLVKGLFD